MYAGHLLLPLLLVGSTKSFIPSGSRTRSCQQQCFSAEDNVSEEVSISSYGLDPSSEAARTVIVEDLGLSEANYQKLVQLSELVTEWNEKINLISRKDCNPSTVFGRHILPSVAVAAVSNDQSNNMANPLATARTVIDIGTGGGFPGLPLAILYPDIDFVLLDSVGKKLTAVQAMADALRLENVQIHHGRAEDVMTTTDRGRFDVATGRSVAAIPQFCAWMHHLLEPQTGHLMYWIGGDVANDLLEKARSQTVIQDVLPGVESDKRILIFPATAVSQIARESGIKVQRLQLNKKKTGTQSSKKKSRGEWAKKSRRDDEPKDGGYSTFQRYSSSSWAAGDSSSSNKSSRKDKES